MSGQISAFLGSCTFLMWSVEFSLLRELNLMPSVLNQRFKGNSQSEQGLWVGTNHVPSPELFRDFS